MKALAIAATGMTAQQANLEVIANNIANLNTTGFKRARAEFTDLLYQVDRLQGVPARADTGVVPEGASFGLGVKLAAVRNVHMQGALATTGNTHDLAIQGGGWFEIEGPDGEVLYTRAGAFNLNAEGEVVTVQGMRVLPNIVVPENALDFTVNGSGQVFARIPGQEEPAELGQLNLVAFANDAGLAPLGDNLFRQTAASGDPVQGLPGVAGLGTISQGYLESSNVDPVREITELINAQRGYEMNSKVITTADQMAATVSQNMR
ncbi:MAG: flagellar basal-body rod protein FlgG [Rhizobiaceae bacterium]|jgi:flagellar basal-body rod protein FlgG|nr:flagellar basal-body rod protein FlgG [Rhizobiaceae bacterium]